MSKNETEEPMRIIELQAENVKRLKAVRLRPDATLVRIEGRNAQGKSSVLDAIAAALGGGKWNPKEPVRRGEKRARVTLDLGDLQVERRWTARGGTTLEVTSKGARLTSPQAILDKLVGDLTFDPLRFVQMPAKEQSDVLMRLAGLDFSEMDAKRETLYAERTVANRNAKSAEARVGSVPPKPASMDVVSVRELADKQAEAFAHNRDVDAAESAAERAAQDVDTATEHSEQDVGAAAEAVGAAERELDSAKARLRDAKDAHANAKQTAAEERASAEQTAAEAKTQAEGLKRADTTALTEQIASAETRNTAIDARRGWEQRSATAKQAATTAEGVDDQIKEIDTEKDRRLTGAKFPLAGLGVDVDGPTLNGIPFSQASSAEQLRTGVAIGLAGKPRARIMLIRDGSLLDTANMEELNRIAVEFDAQVFVERVAESASPSAVYIEDGEVVESENDDA